jgi:hypothetical protein
MPGCENMANQRCSRCKIAKYCSRECQKNHFKEHKLFCESEKQYVVGIPMDDYLKLKDSLEKGKRQFLVDDDNNKEEIILKDNELYEKNTSRKIIAIEVAKKMENVMFV